MIVDRCGIGEHDQGRVLRPLRHGRPRHRKRCPEVFQRRISNIRWVERVRSCWREEGMQVRLYPRISCTTPLHLKLSFSNHIPCCCAIEDLAFRFALFDQAQSVNCGDHCDHRAYIGNTTHVGKCWLYSNDPHVPTANAGSSDHASYSW